MHWTEKMFVEHGDLFLKLTNQRESLVPREIKALERIFSETGVNAGDRVLDLCCGSGRHALNLAKKGFNVTGVDISPTTIKQAKELAEKMNVKNRVEFYVGDARKVSKLLEKKGSFDALISIWTSIGYYDDESDKLIIRQLNKLASSDGVLILDVANRDYMIRHFQPVSIDKLDDYELHEHRKLHLQESRVENTWEFYQKDAEKLKHIVTVPVVTRVYSLHELVRLLETTGWRYCSSYGNFDLEPVTIDTERIIIVGKKV
jgi:ubiquinone/menaquinone biosynthesis C-methylase UbiE